VERYSLGESVIQGDYGQFICWGEHKDSEGTIKCELAWLSRNAKCRILGKLYEHNAGADQGLYVNLMLVPTDHEVI
jgi:hypothetical protein